MGFAIIDYHVEILSDSLGLHFSKKITYYFSLMFRSYEPFFAHALYLTSCVIMQVS